MASLAAQIGVPSNSRSGCVNTYGCEDGVCPHLVLKRHDTRPPLRVSVGDCDGPLDLTAETLVLEASMWAKGKLKTTIAPSDSYFALADNIGFNQAMVGDVIVMDRPRLPEHMLVIGFDEANSLLLVRRGYNGTSAGDWKKGTPLRIFRFMGSPAEITSTYEDLTQEDGTILKDQLSETLLVYGWDAKDTCLPGCYWLEFKLLQMASGASEASILSAFSAPISFTPSTLTPEDFGCTLGGGVEWVRRFPVDAEGFLVRVADSPTAEL